MQHTLYAVWMEKLEGTEDFIGWSFHQMVTKLHQKKLFGLGGLMHDSTNTIFIY